MRPTQMPEGPDELLLGSQSQASSLLPLRPFLRVRLVLLRPNSFRACKRLKCHKQVLSTADLRLAERLDISERALTFDAFDALSAPAYYASKMKINRC